METLAQTYAPIAKFRCSRQQLVRKLKRLVLLAMASG
jgi:hypothetical protein